MNSQNSFNALVVNKNENGETTASVQQLNDEQLPQGNVTVSINYSTLNFKDGLCLGSGGGLVRNYPHVPGIDFCGKVLESRDSRFKIGDQVILTGWGVGERWWGGYSQKASVKGDWLVPLPKKISAKQAMAVGTAGFTSMLAIQQLEAHGLNPENGPVLITGAAGGVGSVAVAILANLGYEVTAVSGRSETETYLRSLGATNILPRSEISEIVKRPLESETWAGCVDAVGGTMLARVLGQMKYGSSVAAVGLAGGAAVPASVIPFLLRGVNLLGIDSVNAPINQRINAWQRIEQDLPRDKLESMTEVVSLGDLPKLGKEILKGQVKGRIVVDVNL